MIEALFSLPLWLLAASLPGIVFAIPSLVPVLRRRAKQSPAWRRGVRYGLSVTSLITMFLLTTWLYASIDVVFYSVFGWQQPEPRYVCTPPDGGACPLGGVALENEDAVRRELWVWHLLPPFIEGCFLRDADACAIADQIAEGNSGDRWVRYGFSWLSALSSALMTFWLVGRATLPDRKRKAD